MELDLLSVKTLAAALLTAACASSSPATAPSAPEPSASAAHAEPQIASALPAFSAPAVSSASAQPPPKPSEPAAPPDAAPPPLPAGTTVLHIGDSMAGALGIELNAELKKAGVHGVLRFKTASFIPTWAWSRDLPSLLLNHNPDLVLVTLGANEIKIKDPQIRVAQIKKLVARFEGRPCVWIAPPLWSTDTGLLPVIRNNIAPCRYLDTNEVYPDMPRLDDKIHPKMSARKEWARRVVEWLARERNPNGEKPWQLRSEPSGR